MKEDIMQQVEASIGELNQSETAVARCVLLMPEDIIQQSLAALAQKAGVSEPTVLRFCRSLGYTGFKDFKSTLAAFVAGDRSFGSTSLQADDTVATMIEKVCHSSANSIKALAASIDTTIIEQCVELLIRAKRVEIYGSGASGIVALDAQYKLSQTKTLAIAHRDSYLQMMSAAGLDSKCVALLLSSSGESGNTVDVAKMAKEQGATVIGITSAHSTLAVSCDLVIDIPKFEDSNPFFPMVAGLCQITLVDILVTGVAMKKGYIASEYRKKLLESVGGLNTLQG